MARWTAFPFQGEYTFDVGSVKKKWAISWLYGLPH